MNIAAALLLAAIGDFGSAVGIEMLGFELVQDLFRSLVHFAGDAGESSDMNAIALVRRALDDLMQENDVVVPFFHGHVEVSHSAQRVLQIG